MNSGKGFNYLEQQYQSKDNFILSPTSLINVDNYRETLDFVADIFVPMNESPVIEKLEFHGQASLVNQIDNLASQHNYNMFLLNLSGKILFK
jgi:hypothetical protein